MYKTQSFKKKMLASAIVSVATLSGVSVADESKDVTEILVTATKRVTTLQKTPLAISAVDSEGLKENHVIDLKDLRGVVPNLQFFENGDHAVPLVFIRGLGTRNQTEAGDQGISFYTDGVYAARAQGTTVMMYDMERVEVLRGPQGTLFGRNSTGGAISMVTAKPVLGEFDASGEFTLGSNHRRGTKAMVNLPMADTWALRIATATEDEEGVVKYSNGNAYRSSPTTTFGGKRKPGTVDMTSYRVTSLFEPSESFKWVLAYENFRNQGVPNLPSVDFDDQMNAATAAGHLDLDSDNLRTRVDYTFGNDITLSYIGGKSEFSQSQLYGNEFQGDIRDTVWSSYDATQHEFQLANSDDNTVRWTAGIYYFEESNGIRFDMPHGSWGFTGQDSTAGVISSFVQPDRSLESLSFYGQATVDISDTFRLTGGLRHTDDTREDVGGRSIDCTYRPVGNDFGTIVPDSSFLNGGQGCYYRQYNDMKGSWDDITYMARAELDLTDDIMLFLSNGTGWKSGVLQDGNGWSAVANNPANANSPLDFSINNDLLQNPETVMNTELGIKSRFGGLTVNANLFFMTFDDMQVTGAVINPVTGESTLTNTNTGGATINGLELESSLIVGDAGLLSLSFAWLDATYDEFLGNDSTFGDARGTTWNPCGISQNGDGTCEGGIFDFSGNTLPYAPETQLTVSYKHDFEVAGGATWTPRIKVSYFGDMYLDWANRGDRPAGTNNAQDTGAKDIDRQASYAKVDVALTYKSSDEKWSLEFYGDNITDEAVKNESFGIGGTPAYAWGPGTEAGMRLNYNFK